MITKLIELISLCDCVTVLKYLRASYSISVQVFSVARCIPDEYRSVSSWSQGATQAGWYCSGPVSHPWCSQCSGQDDGGNFHEVCQVSRY